MHYDTDYNTALGEVTAEFGLLEWDVVYAISLYDPAYVQKAEYERITAGGVRDKLKNCIAGAAVADQAILTDLCARFAAEVERRNDVLHGKPCSSAGKQRLSRKGIVLDLPDLQNRVATFSALRTAFNAYYHARA